MGRQFVSTGGYGSVAWSGAAPGMAVIAAWFYNTGSPSSGFTIAAFGNSSSANKYAGLGITDSSGIYKFNAFTSNGTEFDANTGNALAAKTWHLGVAQISSNFLVCTTNGTNTVTGATGTFPSVNVFTVGALNFGGSVLSRSNVAIYVGEVAVWTFSSLVVIPFSSAELADMYFSRRPLNAYRPGGLLAYWRLLAVNGGIEPDIGPYGRHLTLVGNPPQAPHSPLLRPREPITGGFLPPSVTAPLLPPVLVARTRGHHNAWGFNY